MSEQETNLNIAIERFRLVQSFGKYKECLLEVLNASTKTSDPYASREKVMKIIESKKIELMETNPEFKEIMDARLRENKMRSEQRMAIHKAEIAEIEAGANRLRSGSMARARSSMNDADVEDWVARTRIKKRTAEEAEAELSKNLVCPICNSSSKGNIVNDIPTCFHNTKEYGPWHRLVPQSKLKNYNRAYRRRWKKKRK